MKKYRVELEDRIVFNRIVKIVEAKTSNEAVMSAIENLNKNNVILVSVKPADNFEGEF